MTKAIAIIIALAANEVIAGPSFDCGRAATPTERAICASPNLSALDHTLAEVYLALRATLARDQRDALASAQRSWIVSRDACSGNVECIAARIEERISLLTGSASNTSAVSARRLRISAESVATHIAPSTRTTNPGVSREADVRVTERAPTQTSRQKAVSLDPVVYHVPGTTSVGRFWIEPFVDDSGNLSYPPKIGQ